LTSSAWFPRRSSIKNRRRLPGFTGDDKLYGSDGTDTLHVGDGNDTLIGGAGAEARSSGFFNCLDSFRTECH
jgi:hypothetical protein